MIYGEAGTIYQFTEAELALRMPNGKWTTCNTPTVIEKPSSPKT
jgi:hypothetical protein